MYAVKINTSNTAHDAQLSEEASRLAAELLAEQAAELASNSDHIKETVAFSAGNPRVEHITGKVHLYRHVSKPQDSYAKLQLPVSSARQARLPTLTQGQSS